MPRLTSPNGTVVDVSDETAELLDGFTPVEAPAKKTATKKSAAKSDSK